MTVPSIDSRIDAVTVFRRGALVTRLAEIDPVDGGYPQAVRLAGLPLVADDASFRIRVEPTDGHPVAALPVARDLRVALEVPARATPEPEAWERDLEALRKQEARLQAVVAQTERELSRLDKLSFPKRPAGKEGEPPAPSPTEARMALLRFRAERSHRLVEELLEIRTQMGRLGEKRRELEDRLRRASSDRRIEPHTLRKTVVVTLSRNGHGSSDEPPARFRLLLDYLVPGARWAPAYALLLTPDGSQGEMRMRALVAQRTGEDWTGVRLTLSTANAQSWAELPELGSLRIGRRQPAPQLRGWRPPPAGTAELYRDWDRTFGDSAHRPAGPPWPGAAKPAAQPAFVQAEAAPAATAPRPVDELTEMTMDLSAELAELDMEQTPAGGGESMEMTLEAMPQAPVAAAAAAPGALSPADAPTQPSIPVMAVQRPRQPVMPQPQPPPRPPRRQPPGVRARDDMLAYGCLRMPSARSKDRGRLVLLQRSALYLELVSEQVEVQLDLEQALSEAFSRADAVSGRLPPRYHLAASEDGFDHAYRAESRIHIPSDQHYHSVPLVARPTATRLRHVCVPRQSTDVFRVLEARNPLPGPLLPGPADVYLGEEFLVTGELATTTPGGTLELGLGVDQAVKVSRNTHYREESSGLAKGRLVLAHEIAIEARNHLDRAVELEVRERIPTTRQDEEEIKVELGPVTPPWQPYEPRPEAPGEPLRGAHRWNLKLGPGDTQEFRASYRLRIPAKYDLVGGNRRES